MSDLQVLSAVRTYLNEHAVAQHVHLTIPPNANYPIVIVDLEEVWSPCVFNGNDQRKGIQARIKFKVSVFSRQPGIEEAALISHKTRSVLEGARIALPTDRGDLVTTLRFLACVVENTEHARGNDHTRIIHQFYDCIIRR